MHFSAFGTIKQSKNELGYFEKSKIKTSVSTGLLEQSQVFLSDIEEKNRIVLSGIRGLGVCGW